MYIISITGEWFWSNCQRCNGTIFSHSHRLFFTTKSSFFSFVTWGQRDAGSIEPDWLLTDCRAIGLWIETLRWAQTTKEAWPFKIGRVWRTDIWPVGRTIFLLKKTEETVQWCRLLENHQVVSAKNRQREGTFVLIFCERIFVQNLTSWKTCSCDDSMVGLGWDFQDSWSFWCTEHKQYEAPTIGICDSYGSKQKQIIPPNSPTNNQSQLILEKKIWKFFKRWFASIFFGRGLLGVFLKRFAL